MTRDWAALWRDRTAPADATALNDLLVAGGYDSGFAGFDEAAWRAAAARRVAELGLEPGSTVHEVGCGPGAFLLALQELGCRVGGLDPSPGLIEVARAALPDARLEVAEASALTLDRTVDAVVSVGAFLYFPSHAYAEGVVARMARGARRAVGIYDLPDAALQGADRARREQLAGGPEAYAERYAGLEHRYYEREWVVEQLERCGLHDVHVAGQDLEGYGNAPFRFNAWGFQTEADAEGDSGPQPGAHASERPRPGRDANPS